MDDSRTLQLILKLQDDISSQLQGVSAQLGNLDSKSKGVSSTLMGLAKTFVSLYAIKQVAGYLYDSVDAFGQFDASIQRAGAFVDATAGQLDDFRKAAINAAQGTTFSAQQTADALGSFVGGGISAAEAAENLGKVVDLALVAKLNDLQSAVDISSTALTVFKEDNIGISDVIDDLSAVAANVTTRTDDWATALTNSAGSAKAAGLSFKDLNVIFAEMVGGGADVNHTWAAFNSAINRIQAPTKQTAEALQAVGLSTKGLQDALSGGPITMLSYLKKGFEEANKSGQGFAFLSETLGQQAAPEFAIALSRTNDEMATTAGYFEDITGAGDKMVQKIRQAIPVTDQLKQGWTQLSLAVGGFLSNNSLVHDALSGLATAMVDLAVWIGNAHSNIQGFLEYIDQKTGLVTYFKLIWDSIVQTFQENLLPAILKLWDALQPLLPFLGALAVVIGYALGGAILLLINTLTLLLTWVTNIATFLTDVFSGALNGIIDIISNLIIWVEKLIDAFKEAWDWAQKVAGSVGKSISGTVSAVVKTVTGKATGGPVSGGTPYIVGEQGPELFVPNTGGSIVPNGQLGGAGVTINVYGDVSGQELLDKVRSALALDIKRAVRL